MTTSEPVHDADPLATIIPFRPRRSTMALHPSAGSPEPVPSETADGLWPLRRPAPIQLSFFDPGPTP